MKRQPRTAPGGAAVAMEAGVVGLLGDKEKKRELDGNSKHRQSWTLAKLKECGLGDEIGLSLGATAVTAGLLWVVWVVAPGSDAEAATVAAAAGAPVASEGFKAVLGKAANRAFKGGVAGFTAGLMQVFLFMWLRTSMNYQYANGGNLKQALSTLYAEGGVKRFYQGVGFAAVQAPLSRFGDTAANGGMLLLLDIYAPGVPIALKSLAASGAASTWRIFLTPIDTLKTTRQVQGPVAYDLLQKKIKEGGFGILYAGALANFAASWAGNYPWFLVFNTLQEVIDPAEGVQELVRNALIGFCASTASDTISNSLRVVKTVRQTSPDPNVGYIEAAKGILETDGVRGLFGRGLATRILTNGLQGMFFSVVWKYLEEILLKQ